MKKVRLFGLIILFIGIVVIVVRIVQRFLREERREIPPPDRVLETARPTPPAVGDAEAEEMPDSNIEEQDAPPPPVEPPVILAGPNVSFAPGMSTKDTEKLWEILQQETFRMRGEGYRKDWVFHLYATREQLGAPLARTASEKQRIKMGGKEYGYQVFARDTLFNEIPKWGEFASMNELLGGSMPSEGSLAHALLAASYQAMGQELHTDWAFHKVALERKLGPALGDAHRITVEGTEYSLQVFACDTLYVQVPNWQDVQRLSETGAGPLQDALVNEAFSVSGIPYNPKSDFHQVGVQEQLGTPLSGIFTVDMEGTPFNTQVFALDTLYAPLDGSPPERQSALFKPKLPDIEPVAAKAAVSPPVMSEPGDALSDKRPVFALLPVAGRPRISQFFGYTKFAAGKGRGYYTFCQGRHPGIDFAVPEGTPLLAIGHGVVMCAGVAKRDCTFGGSPPQIAIVRYGSVYAIYGHASKVNVKKGQAVNPGDVVCWSGTYGGPHLHFEIRPVPDKLLKNTDPNQNPVNPGFAVNPTVYFSDELQAYFQEALNKLGGSSHFCVGSFHDQEKIVFAGPVDNRPCTN